MTGFQCALAEYLLVIVSEFCRRKSRNRSYTLAQLPGNPEGLKQCLCQFPVTGTNHEKLNAFLPSTKVCACSDMSSPNDAANPRASQIRDLHVDYGVAGQRQECGKCLDFTGGIPADGRFFSITGQSRGRRGEFLPPGACRRQRGALRLRRHHTRPPRATPTGRAITSTPAPHSKKASAVDMG